MTTFSQTDNIKLGVDEVKPEIVIKPEESMVIHKLVSDSECDFLHESKKGEMNDEEIEQDSSPDILDKTKRENNSEMCRYCDVVGNICEMVLIPDNPLKLSYWLEKFGPVDYKNITVNSSKYICWRHFNSLNLVKPSYINYWGDRNKTSPKRIEKHEVEKIRSTHEKADICRYCNVFCKRSEMLLVPDDPMILFRWVERLGATFLNKLAKNSNNYICSSHLNSPTCPDQSYPPQPIWTQPRWVTRDCICRYCGSKCNGYNMTSVPENKQLLLKWAEILGERFLKNVRRYRYNWICWSHFKYRNEGRRNADNLPMTDEMLEIELANVEVEENEEEIEKMRNEEKADIEMLQEIVKTEGEDDQYFDIFQNPEMFLMKNDEFDSVFLEEEKYKPLLFMNEE